MTPFRIEPITPENQAQAAKSWCENWGSTRVVSRGRMHDLTQLPGFIAWYDNTFAGAATYRIDGDDCEVTSLESLMEGIGIGTKLIELVDEAAREAGCRRVWLITTNDNTRALRFYQRRGFHLVAVHRDAVTEARKIKPEIPLVGFDEIPLRDEIELERLIESGA